MAERASADNGFDRQHFLSKCDPVADTLREHLIGSLQELVDSFYKRARDASVENPAAQDGEMRDALNQLRLKQAELSRHLCDEVASNFDPDAEQRAMQATINISFEELSLQETASLDENIAITNVGNRCELLYEHQLWEIRQRMEWWRDERFPRVSDKSLGPYAICRAFFEAMRRSKVDKQLQLMLFWQFDRFVMRHLHEVYEELIRIFDRHGFHPLRPQSQRSNPAPEPAHTSEVVDSSAQAAAEPAADTAASAGSEQAGPATSAQQPPTPTASNAPIDPQTWEMLQQLGQWAAGSPASSPAQGGQSVGGSTGPAAGSGGGVGAGGGGGHGQGQAAGPGGGGGHGQGQAAGPGGGGGHNQGQAAGPGGGGGHGQGQAAGPGGGGGHGQGQAAGPGGGGGHNQGQAAGPGGGGGHNQGQATGPGGGGGHGQGQAAGPGGGGGGSAGSGYGDAQLASDLATLFRGQSAPGWSPARAHDINARVSTLGRAFNQLLADPNVARSIKPQFDSLRFSLVKTALADGRFFRDAHHPMRELLNELALLATTSRLYNPEEVRHLSQMLTRLHQDYATSAEQVRDAQSEEAELTGKELEQFLDQLQQEQRKRRAALIEKSRRVVSEELWLQLASRRCSEGLRESLSNSWEPMMALRLLRHGVDSKSWNRGITMLQQIIDLADPPTGVAVGDSDAKAVLAAFSTELRGVGMLDERVDGLVRSLQYSLSESAPRQRDKDWQAKTKPSESLPDTREELLQLVLVPNSWFEVYDKQRDAIRWLQARGYEAATDEAVFTEFRGQQGLRLPGTEFISDLSKGLSAAINPTPKARAALHTLTRSNYP